MGKKKRSKLMCRLTGGHRYNPWESEFRHTIDGLYSVKSVCTKCGYVRQDLVPIHVESWSDKVKEAKEYDGKKVAD